LKNVNDWRRLGANMMAAAAAAAAAAALVALNVIHTCNVALHL